MNNINYFDYELILRLLAALAAGIVIGVERQHRAKEAGIRTHATVALASCLLMIISKYGFMDVAKVDASRVASTVVTGVGFLGAGVIFVRHDAVQGLTTAAGIWATSAIGMCFGSSLYLIGLFSTILMYIVQHVLYRYFPHNHLCTVLKVKIRMERDDGVSEVVDILNANRYHPIGESQLTSDGAGGWYLLLEAITHQPSLPGTMLEELKSCRNITSVEVL